ncbi:hypothetical protein LINPERHAP2_LOCUS12487 [Linum perenne]
MGSDKQGFCDLGFSKPDGLAVTSATLIPTEAEKLCDYVQNLLGKRSATSDLSSGRIKMTWLHTNFAYREGAIRDNDIETIHQYCRAYILDFFGSCIFADRSGAYAHLFFLPFLEDLNRVGEHRVSHSFHPPSSRVSLSFHSPSMHIMARVAVHNSSALPR